MNFYEDPSKVDEYEAMCEEYDGSDLYLLLDKYLEDGATLLELGSGPGNDLAYLMTKYRVTGSDLSGEFLKRCKKRFADTCFLKLDAVTIDTKKQFDAIFSNKVLHHLSSEELEKSFKRQQKVLKQGGFFAHSFWLGDKDMVMEGMLFKFYDKEYLLELITKYFTICETYVYTEMADGEAVVGEDDSIFVVAKNDRM